MLPCCCPTVPCLRFRLLLQSRAAAAHTASSCTALRFQFSSFLPACSFILCDGTRSAFRLHLIGMPPVYHAQHPAALLLVRPTHRVPNFHPKNKCFARLPSFLSSKWPDAASYVRSTFGAHPNQRSKMTAFATRTADGGWHVAITEGTVSFNKDIWETVKEKTDAGFIHE